MEPQEIKALLKGIVFLIVAVGALVSWLKNR